MNKKFKVFYYLLITVFTLVFSYQIYLLVNVILEKPHYEVGFLTSEDE